MPTISTYRKSGRLFILRVIDLSSTTIFADAINAHAPAHAAKSRRRQISSRSPFIINPEHRRLTVRFRTLNAGGGHFQILWFDRTILLCFAIKGLAFARDW